MVFQACNQSNESEDVAIIGMACLFPMAPTIGSYWQNIVSGKCAISDPPADWEAERYFAADGTGNDRTYCKRGGYLGDLAKFDPLAFGVMPSSLDGGEPDQFLALKVAKEALLDAGYDEKSIDSERTEVIVGRGTYINRGVTNSFQHTVVVDQTIDILKNALPNLQGTELQAIKERLKQELPPFNAETVPSLVPNVLAGRIANRLNIMGVNYLVDAACASSLIAVEHGMRDLRSGKADLALVGGVNASIPPTMLVIFSQITALSRKEALQPFDESSDGTMLGEGLGFVVLKRKSDAVRDGDRIYAVIKAVGVASDGRALGPLSPRIEGEALAIRRAYDEAGVSPQTVALIEAHGTGTPVGDRTEIDSLRMVFGEGEGKRPSCALGTVKSMIGHLIPASGIAALIKTALAIYHKVLPPTLCEKPNPHLGLEKSPFFINTSTRPWIHARKEHPRRAGVNAFGFGGINAHALLEEHDIPESSCFESYLRDWDSEVFLFQGETRTSLIAEMESVSRYLKENPGVCCKDLAFSLTAKEMSSANRLAIVATSGEDLLTKVENARKRLEDPSCTRIRTKSGIYFFAEPLGKTGKIAFLFPGEGAQYPDMLADLCLHFPEVRRVFDRMDRTFSNHKRGYLPSHTVFPIPLGQDKGSSRLWNMDSAAESVFSANMALLEVMKCLDIKPDVLLGHSTGEYSSVLASGIIDVESEEQFSRFVLGVNEVYEKLSDSDRIAEGILVTIGAMDEQRVKETLSELDLPIIVAMENCPLQTVVCGKEDAISKAEEAFRKKGAILERLPFNRAYHTPFFKPICDALLDFFRQLEVKPPRIRIYSCVSGGPYPNEAGAIRELATSQWARKVCFTDSVRALYEEGVRIFVEVGPRGNLISFVDNIIQKKPYLSVAANLQRRSGITQLNHLVGLLAAHHVPLAASFLYKYRSPVKLDFSGPEKPQNLAKKSRTDVPIKLTLPRLKLENMPFPSQPTASEGAGSFLSAKARTEGKDMPGPKDGRTQAMTAYLQNMEKFLDAQNDLFQKYLAAKRNPGGQNRPAMEESFSHGNVSEKKSTFPFVRQILTYVPGVELKARCTLNLSEDIFLRDHTLGGKVSMVDERLIALPVVPLTFSMEIMAEAACYIFEGKKRLVGMREIRASRWLGLDRGEIRLGITARVSDDKRTEVSVAIFDQEGAGDRAGVVMPVIEGVMLFAEDYPNPPKAGEIRLSGERMSRWSGKDLYGGFMFHGPLLQGVGSMENWGEDGATAILKSLPTEKLIDSCRNPNFVIDPVMLDAAGQVIAYWTSDHLTEAFHIFPFRLESLTLYGERMANGEQAECRARIDLVETLQVRSDIDIIDADGKVRMRLLGWWDRRFAKPDNFYKLRMNPKGAMLSEPWQAESHGWINPAVTFCMLRGIDESFLTAHNRIWLRVLAHLVLSEAERRFWYDMKASETRRMEWLLGRVAIKDCCRYHFRKNGRINLCPADIEIRIDKNGKPEVVSVEGKKPAEEFSVSLSHSGGVTLAALGPSGETGLGVDIEIYRPLAAGFEDVAFTETEKQTLSGYSNSEKCEWALRLWCAKEAAVKMKGIGLLGNPKGIQVRSLNEATGEVEVEKSLATVKTASEPESEPVRVQTIRQGDLVIAVAS